MKTSEDKNDKAAHDQLARDRACLYLRHGFSVAETAQELGKSRAFVYDAKAKGGRDAVPVPVVTGDSVIPEGTLAALRDAPFKGIDTVEDLAREALRLYALAEPKAAEGDRVAAFIQDSMLDCISHIDAYKDRIGVRK